MELLTYKVIPMIEVPELVEPIELDPASAEMMAAMEAMRQRVIDKIICSMGIPFDPLGQSTSNFSSYRAPALFSVLD